MPKKVAKCWRCRKDKKKCVRNSENQPDRCDWCIKYNWECSPDELKKNNSEIEEEEPVEAENQMDWNTDDASPETINAEKKLQMRKSEEIISDWDCLEYLQWYLNRQLKKMEKCLKSKCDKMGLDFDRARMATNESQFGNLVQGCKGRISSKEITLAKLLYTSIDQNEVLRSVLRNYKFELAVEAKNIADYLILNNRAVEAYHIYDLALHADHEFDNSRRPGLYGFDIWRIRAETIAGYNFKWANSMDLKDFLMSFDENDSKDTLAAVLTVYSRSRTVSRRLYRNLVTYVKKYQSEGRWVSLTDLDIFQRIQPIENLLFQNISLYLVPDFYEWFIAGSTDGPIEFIRDLEGRSILHTGSTKSLKLLRHLQVPILRSTDLLVGLLDIYGEPPLPEILAGNPYGFVGGESKTWALGALLGPTPTTAGAIEPEMNPEDISILQSLESGLDKETISRNNIACGVPRSGSDLTKDFHFTIESWNQSPISYTFPELDLLRASSIFFPLLAVETMIILFNYIHEANKSPEFFRTLRELFFLVVIERDDEDPMLESLILDEVITAYRDELHEQVGDGWDAFILENGSLQTVKNFLWCARESMGEWPWPDKCKCNGAATLLLPTLGSPIQAQTPHHIFVHAAWRVVQAGCTLRDAKARLNSKIHPQDIMTSKAVINRLEKRFETARNLAIYVLSHCNIPSNGGLNEKWGSDLSEWLQNYPEFFEGMDCSIIGEPSRQPLKLAYWLMSVAPNAT